MGIIHPSIRQLDEQIPFTIASAAAAHSQGIACSQSIGQSTSPT